MDSLVVRALPRRFGQGDVVFAEGDPCQGLYVIESGTVRIFKTSASGREQVLTVEGPGSSIAELPVFDGGAYPASAAAASPASLLFISKNDFQAPLPAAPTGGSEGVASSRGAPAWFGLHH